MIYISVILMAYLLLQGVGDCAWLPNHTALFAVGKKFALLKVDYENLRESQLDGK